MSRVSSPIIFPCLSSHLSIPVRVFVPRVACGAGAHGGSAGARGIGGGGGGRWLRWLRLSSVGFFWSSVGLRWILGVCESQEGLGLGFGSHLVKQWQGGTCMSMGE